MIKKLFSLKSQLEAKGVTEAEFTAGEELPESRWDEVSGGFAQVVFEQLFSQLWNPNTGFRQNVFTQRIQ